MSHDHHLLRHVVRGGLLVAATSLVGVVGLAASTEAATPAPTVSPTGQAIASSVVYCDAEAHEIQVRTTNGADIYTTLVRTVSVAIPDTTDWHVVANGFISSDALTVFEVPELAGERLMFEVDYGWSSLFDTTAYVTDTASERPTVYQWVPALGSWIESVYCWI